jgi:hypothetical protein
MDNCDFVSVGMRSAPSLAIVGGSKQEYHFHFYELDMITPVSMIGATSTNFKLSHYGHLDKLVLNIEGQLIAEEPYNVIAVTMNAEDTQSLYGKFIYQLVLEGYQSGYFIPFQGTMTIFQMFYGTSESYDLYLPE